MAEGGGAHPLARYLRQSLERPRSPRPTNLKQSAVEEMVCDLQADPPDVYVVSAERSLAGPTDGTVPFGFGRSSSKSGRSSRRMTIRSLRDLVRCRQTATFLSHLGRGLERCDVRFEEMSRDCRKCQGEKRVDGRNRKARVCS